MRGTLTRIVSVTQGKKRTEAERKKRRERKTEKRRVADGKKIDIEKGKERRNTMIERVKMVAEIG